MLHYAGPPNEQGNQVCVLCGLGLAGRHNPLPVGAVILEQLEGPDLEDYSRWFLCEEDQGPAGAVKCTTAHRAFMA
jgi:hypothetical protein